MKWNVIAVLAIIALSSPAEAQVAVSGPTLPSERQTTESPRSVAAGEYRDAYCAKWTDGCDICERKTAGEDPSCQPAAGADAACGRQPVQCQAVLRTINRVCLTYTDGCNRCAGGSCTAMSCQRPTDYRCTAPRRSRYDDPQLLRLDLRGHWRLIDPQGRSCEIVMDREMSLSGGCIALGAPVTQVKQMRTAGPVVEMVRPDGETVLRFGTQDLDSLSGIGQATGYRLVRLESEPLDFWQWEGNWTLKVAGGSNCDLFLSMRTRRIDQVDIKVPHEVAFPSHCISPTDADSIQISVPLPPENRIDRGLRTVVVIMRPVLLPRWSNWQLEGHDITFGDGRDGHTVFKFDNEKSWTAEISQAGYPPVVLQLERRPR